MVNKPCLLVLIYQVNLRSVWAFGNGKGHVCSVYLQTRKTLYGVYYLEHKQFITGTGVSLKHAIRKIINILDELRNAFHWLDHLLHNLVQ